MTRPRPGLFRTKPLDVLIADTERPEGQLRRALGAWNVVLLGIGAIVGAGIFATIGTAAAGDAHRPGAGPSIVLSFVITAVVCALTALCYAEMASMVPVSGSAYTYSYATLGELPAWIIGWDLIIEYAVGNVAVAISWANYARSFLEELGIHVPLWASTDFRTAAKIPGLLESAPRILGVPIVFNFLAFAIVAALTVILVWGIRESAAFNAAMVMVKIVVLIFFCVFLVTHVPLSEMRVNWTPFQPNGWSGTLAGAAIVFFAYIGFDAVSTVAEETRTPRRDLPIGILGSLAISTALYVVVSAVFVSVMPYGVLQQKLATEQAEPLTMAISHAVPGASWATALVALGSVVAHTAVLLVFQMGQPRIFFSMARDGLLPPTFARVHRRFRTPHVTTIVTGLLVGTVAGIASIDEMVDLTNIGTLFAFVLVCLGIPVLRAREPLRTRPFRVPFGPWIVPLLGAAACVTLMIYLPPLSWWRFVGWLTLGLAVYCAYGFRHSRLRDVPGSMAGPLDLAAIGFLGAAIGMFVMPHDSGFVGVFARAAEGGRAAWGVGLLSLGLLIAAAGVAAARRRAYGSDSTR